MTDPHDGPPRVSALWPAHIIDWRAFFAALVLAPFLFTLVTSPLIIPVFAVIMGGPVYLVVGTPTLMWLLSRGIRSPGGIALAAFVANTLASAIALGVVGLAFGLADDLTVQARAQMLYGAVFAPLWGLVFAWLYNWFSPNPA